MERSGTSEPHRNKILKTWRETLSLPGLFLTFRGDGILLLLLGCFVSFLQLTYHVQRHAIQNFSLILKLIMLFFFSIIKHVSAET